MRLIASGGVAIALLGSVAATMDMAKFDDQVNANRPALKVKSDGWVNGLRWNGLRWNGLDSALPSETQASDQSNQHQNPFAGLADRPLGT